MAAAENVLPRPKTWRGDCTAPRRSVEGARMSSEYEPEELFSLRSYFYVGAFGRALQEAGTVIADTPTLRLLAQSFEVRAHLALGHAYPGHVDVSSPAMQALRLLGSRSEGVMDALDRICAEHDSEIMGDPVSRLLIGLVYQEVGNYKAALNLVHKGDALEELAVAAQIYAKIDRVDLAEKQVARMTKLDEDDVLTVISTATLGRESESPPPLCAHESRLTAPFSNGQPRC